MIPAGEIFMKFDIRDLYWNLSSHSSLVKMEQQISVHASFGQDILTLFKV
jgi:hypothetical protein